MPTIQKFARPVDRSTIAQWFLRRCGMLLIALLMGASHVGAASAQTTSQYCYVYATQQCFDSLEKAEQAMRAAPENSSIATLLEPDVTEASPFTHTAVYRYRVKDQPATLSSPSYNPVPSTTWGNACVVGSDVDPSRSRWCANEEELVATVMREFVQGHPSCTVSAPVVTSNNRPEPYRRVEGDVPFNKAYGTVVYGNRNYRMDYTCSGVAYEHTFWIDKEAGFVCPSGYDKLADGTPNDGNHDLTLPVLCQYIYGERSITGPIRQVASCKASRYPCYPATGDKARAEPDFVFAGRTFTRHYHSLHEFRNNNGFGIGWTHTFSDRVFGFGGGTPVALIDDTGTYEHFSTIATNRYRGENSTNKLLEYVPTGKVRWRLLLPDGEIREFDAEGLLLRITNPVDPRMDATVTYANGLLSTVTDSQGRRLKFEYSPSKMLTRIALPDGAGVTYGYDADRNLTSVDYGNAEIKQYHYAEAGLAGDPSQRNHLTGITSEDHKRFASFKYDSRGRVIESRVFGAPSDVTTVSYDSDTQATVTTAPGTTRVYTIEPGVYRRVTAVNTVNQGGTADTFDALGRLQSSQDKRGVVTNFEYAANNAYRSAVVEAVGTPEQRRMEYTHDPVSNLVTERRTLDATGTLKARTTWTYNARNQVTSTTVTDPATSATRTVAMTYCESQNVSDGLCPMVGLLTLVDGPLTGTADSLRYTYRQTDAASCATSPTTCPYRKGDLWKTTNALDHVTEVLSYDGAGRVRSVRDANGVVTEAVYDLQGRLTASKVRGTDDATEADDRINRIDYWPTGEIKQVTQPDGVLTQFVYDDAQRLIGIADNAGNSIMYTLNAAGERTREDTKDTGGTLRRTLSRTYNTLGQLLAMTDAYNRSTGFTYDANGNADQTTDALTRISDNNHDPLNRLARSLQDVNGVAAETKFEYNALDQLEKVTDPKGLDTTYRYNAFGEMTRLISPDTGTTNYLYDGAGNRTSQTDARGMQTQYAYDVLSRVTAVSYAQDASLNIGYVYDVAQADCTADEAFLIGRLARMTDGSDGDGTTYCYNRFGQLTRKVQRTQGKTFTQRWQYAANGRLQSMTYPDGAIVDYVYNVHGRVTEIGVTNGQYGRQVLVNNIGYYPFGPVAQWTYGNGRTLTRTYNLNYQPGIVQDTAPGGVSIGYQFDEVGNLKRLRNGDQTDPPARVFGYDGLNRLTEAKDGANVLQQSYSYDKTGNRLSAGRLQVSQGQDCSNVPPGGTCTPTGPVSQWINSSYSYQPNNHRLWTLGTTQRNYDAAGNLISTGPMVQNGFEDPLPGGETESASYGGTVQAIGTDDGSTPPPGVETRTFGYNAANRMSSVSVNGEFLMSYHYNGAGERVYRSGNGDAVHTVFDPSGHWLGDYDANGVSIQQVIWLGDLPVGLLARIGGVTQLHYIEADMLGTPRVVIEPVAGTLGKAVWRWDLAGEAFGDEAPNEDPDGDGNAFVFDMRFPGQQYDSASKLNYNYFRDYEATTGRYVESDPIGLMGGTSTYGYVRGNPVGLTDSSGLCPKKCSDSPDTAPHHIVVVEDIPESWIERHLQWDPSKWGNPGARLVTYEVRDRHDRRITGMHYWQERLSRQAAINNTVGWTQLPVYGRFFDIHDFYSQKRARELRMENTTQTVYQYFFIRDQAGCVVRVRTMFEISFDFVDGMQTNHRISSSENVLPYDW